MNNQRRKDSAIAAAVTFVVAMLILLLLFTLSIDYDREAIASASQPEIQSEELMFVEPELDISTPGEQNELPDEGDAPLPQGEPEPAPVEQPDIVTPGKSPEPRPSVEQPVSAKQPSPVKATENTMTDAERKRLQSLNASFSTATNGSRQGTTAVVNGKGTVNTKGSLTGREFKGCPTSKTEITEPQTVKVKVIVAADGHVKEATVLTGKDPYRGICRQWALKAKWSKKEGAPDATGTITFTIK